MRLTADYNVQIEFSSIKIEYNQFFWWKIITNDPAIPVSFDSAVAGYVTLEIEIPLTCFLPLK